MFHRFHWTGVSSRRNSITEEYEPLQPFFLIAAMERMGCKCFIDVGANIGAYSLFASQVASVDRIIAFEANPDVAAELRTNLAANGIAGDVREVAVSDAPGEIEFGIVSRYAGNSGVAATAHSGTQYAKTVKVPAVTLDTALADLPYPAAFKVDVEGHEAAVLGGAQAALTAGKCIVQIENYGDTLTPVFAELGYRRLAAIGPDQYFTNDDGLVAAELFEECAQLLIASNHENKRGTFRRGGVGVELSGKSYRFVKGLAERVMRGRL